ncbi:tripartite tricarboxylate transporter substrate binding protein [Ramlibacter sp. G-1-2-2]|uniref:Tripartite tricarboxylate transporter substrate binding protein n=1 Tax=Ramlibacter agri TaxID=2728837 RepID=A0A848H015_9BURK|nr:tripartite tricarboxylate transporter substrate binding protein [Ramlibacter agri]NML44155.1 tripartite tricarboxylate transporter substrate binding protein [Ramlibacter agri]
MPMQRRHALAAIAAGALPAFAFAQSGWPNKPIKMVVPLTAGGPTDLLARILAQPLGERLGQTIVIDNRPGAGGDIGAEFVAHSEPDGYTLFLGTSGPLSINATLYGNLKFDPIKDFAPITLAADAPFVVVVNPKLPVKTLPELIAYAKAHPGKLNDGSVTGSAAHLATELFKRSVQLDFVHVSYKGAAVATTDLLAGQIDLSFASTPGVMGYIKAGKLRPLAVTSATRLKDLPDVPTVAEAGVAGYEASVWYGVLAPAGTPEAIVARLNTELTRILQDKKVLQQMAQNDFHPLGSTPAQFGAFIKSESDKWGKVVKAAGIKAG